MNYNNVSKQSNYDQSYNFLSELTGGSVVESTQLRRKSLYKLQSGNDNVTSLFIKRASLAS